MKKFISLFSIVAGMIIFCSTQGNAQNNRYDRQNGNGNGHHNGNGNNNNNWNHNNGGNYGHNGNQHHYNGGGHHHNQPQNHCNTGGYSSGSSFSFGYTYVAPCAPNIVVVRPYCAPRPQCRRW